MQRKYYLGQEWGCTSFYGSHAHCPLKQSAEIAAAAFVVDAIDDDAWRFYRHFDFIPFHERRDRLFLSMKTVAALFPALDAS